MKADQPAQYGEGLSQAVLRQHSLQLEALQALRCFLGGAYGNFLRPRWLVRTHQPSPGVTYVMRGLPRLKA